MNHRSGMDAMFLHIESPQMPMHIGSLNVLDLPEGHSGEFNEDAKKTMAERLHGNLLLGSVPGVIVGSLLGAKVPEKLLRTLIALVLVAVGLKLVL